MDQILNSDIRKLIELSLLNPPKKIELEARFTDYHLDQGIDIRTFYRLSKYFENYKSENTSSIDRTYIPEKLRYTIITAPGKPPEKILIRKETLKRFPEVTNYYKFKISLSTEETVNITKEYINRIDSSPSKDLLTRIKNRTSYYVTDDVRVDMTKVEETKNDISISKYELELELINYPAIQEWYSQILNILRLMQNTEIIYTFNDYSTLLSNVNKYLDNPNFTQLGIDNTKVLMDARNLKFRDLVYGGIVGSKIGDVNVGYRVTVKSDGERKLMVINNDGIWFIWNNEVNKFHSSDEFTARYNGYIFDGELIPRSAQKEVVPQKYWYLIFDLINYNDGKVIDRSIRKEPHSVRMRFAQGVKNYIVENNVATRDLSNILLLETKRFYNIKDIQSFHENMNMVNEQRLSVPYLEDGFIFVPDEAPYKRTKVNLNKRILTETVDICKVKQVDQITIDAAILRIPPKNVGERERIIIQAYDRNKTSKLIEYTQKGYVVNPIFAQVFSSITLSAFKLGDYIYTYLKNLDVSDISSDNTVEFSWNKEKNIYKATISNKPKMTSLTILGNKLIKRENFVIGLVWKKEDDKNKKMELYHIQKLDPIRPSLNYVKIDRPVDETHELLKGVLSGYIVEFKWDYIKNHFTPVRLRSNKQLPNSVETINDNLILLEDPIEFNTLLGKDIRLMRKYHNRIKKRLFTNAGGQFLLDLGTGRGGDIAKMIDYKKIIAVEPNLNHITRLIELAKKIFGLPEIKIFKSIEEIDDVSRDRIIILQTKAQDYNFITAAVNKFFGRPADVISMMLSLSFFWENEQVLQGLITTISNNLIIGGLFIYMTIDGNKVKQIFDPPVKGFVIKEPISLLNGDVTIRYNVEPDSSRPVIKVRYKGTIVEENGEEQTEYLVMLDDLRSYFGNIGIIETSYNFANREPFLNDSETKLTELYSSGTFIRKSKGNVLMKWKSPLLLRGEPVKSLAYSINKIQGVFVYKMEIIPCKWFKNRLYRWGQPTLKKKLESLIFSIIRIKNLGGIPIVNDVLESVENSVKILKDQQIYTDEEVNLEDFVIKLGEFYKIDISIVDITSNNLIPVVTKIGNYDNAIVIGRTDNGFENIGEYVDNQIKFIFGSKINISHLVLSLAGITLLDKISDDKIKEYNDRFMSTIYNGEKNFPLIVEMKKLTS